MKLLELPILIMLIHPKLYLTILMTDVFMIPTSYYICLFFSVHIQKLGIMIKLVSTFCQIPLVFYWRSRTNWIIVRWVPCLKIERQLVRQFRWKKNAYFWIVTNICYYFRNCTDLQWKRTKRKAMTYGQMPFRSGQLKPPEILQVR